MLRFSYRVPPSQDGLTLRSLLKRELRFSTAMVQKLKATDGVRVQGEVLRVFQRVTTGMEVEFQLPPELPTDAPVEHGPLTVLYEDAGLLAVEKPPGMLTHPSLKQHHGTLVSLALGYVEKKGEAPTLHPLHRLDRDTSGIVAFAKHAHIQGHWMEQLKAGQVEKDYLGLALGRMPSQSGDIEGSVGRAPDSYLTRRVDPEGLPAKTAYRELAVHTIDGHTVTEVLLCPVTGRTHQLRLHCLSAGAPLLGDTQYDTPESRRIAEAWGLAGQMLHAWRLAFWHPLTGDRLEIRCPMTRHQAVPALREIGGALPRSERP